MGGSTGLVGRWGRWGGRCRGRWEGFGAGGFRVERKPCGGAGQGAGRDGISRGEKQERSYAMTAGMILPCYGIGTVQCSQAIWALEKWIRRVKIGIFYGLRTLGGKKSRELDIQWS